MSSTRDLLLGVIAGEGTYLLRRWAGEELTVHLLKPFFKFLAPFFRPFGQFIKERVVKTEQQALMWLHYKNKAAHKHTTQNDIDSITF